MSDTASHLQPNGIEGGADFDRKAVDGSDAFDTLYICRENSLSGIVSPFLCRWYCKNNSHFFLKTFELLYNST